MDVRTLLNVGSCLNGNLYDGVSIPDSALYRKGYDFVFDGAPYNTVVHYTSNKKGHMKVCSVSLFTNSEGGKKKFLAYLFTTNDPLAFDNFNCFRGGPRPQDIDLSASPALKCVEQIVFCEYKVRVALDFLKHKTAGELHDFVTKNRINWKLIRELMDDPNLNVLLAGVESDPAKSRSS